MRRNQAGRIIESPICEGNGPDMALSREDDMWEGARAMRRLVLGMSPLGP